MQVPDTPGREKAALTDRLNELESLIGEGPEDAVTPGGERAASRPAVPVLDELVTAEDDDEDAPDETGAPLDDEGRLEDFALRIEQKLSAELDEIINILKGNLKESIISELHDRVKKEHGDNS